MTAGAPPGRAEAIAYYKECWVDRFRAGHNPRSNAIHYGIYATGAVDAEEAKLGMNLHVAERLDLDGSGAVAIADLGCGVGGTAIHLARRFATWSVCGVDQTRASLDYARGRARDAGVESRVSFVETDYADTGLSRTFDGAYAIESACHAFDREQLAREMFRLLRPGAAVVVADFFRTARPLDASALRRYAALKLGFAVADYYDADFCSQLRAAGFASVDVCDLTDAVRPGTRRSATKAHATLESWQRQPQSQRMARHLAACVAVDELCASGHLVYRSVRARRR